MNEDWEAQEVEFDELEVSDYSEEYVEGCDCDECLEYIAMQLDCCDETPAKKAVSSILGSIKNGPANKIPKELNMNTNINVDPGRNLEAEAKDHLINRVYNTQYEKKNAAEEKFLPVTENPKTMKDLRKMLADGWLTIDSKFKDDRSVGYSWTNYFVLQDPAKPRDHEGYKNAIDAIETDYTKVVDAIKVLPATDGLKALNDFEAKTYH